MPSKSSKSSVELKRDRVDILIRERFSSSYMSDAKWVRLLEALIDARSLFESCQVKLVWEESTRDMWIPQFSSFGFAYYRSSMEGMISGTPRGFYTYKEVEWIELSAEAGDAEIIALKLEKIGKFELVRGEKCLRLYAYR